MITVYIGFDFSFSFYPVKLGSASCDFEIPEVKDAQDLEEIVYSQAIKFLTKSLGISGSYLTLSNFRINNMSIS